MVEVSIREATEKDLNDVFEVVNTAYKVEWGDTGVSFKSCDRYDKIEEAENDLKNTYVATCVQTGDIVGSVRIVLVKDGQEAFVGPVAVNPKYQGQGIGSKLIQFAETKAPVIEIGVVSCRTDLIPFYEKMGFKTFEKWPLEKFVPPHRLSRSGLFHLHMKKSRSS